LLMMLSMRRLYSHWKQGNGSAGGGKRGGNAAAAGASSSSCIVRRTAGAAQQQQRSEGGVFSSFLQMRGSIPTYWTQESSVTNPKSPPIIQTRLDTSHKATRAHFADLLTRYSYPIIVLSLIKQNEKRAEREVIVGNTFQEAIEEINSSIGEDRRKIRYCALDYSHMSKHNNNSSSNSSSRRGGGPERSSSAGSSSRKGSSSAATSSRSSAGGGDGEKRGGGEDSSEGGGGGGGGFNVYKTLDEVANWSGNQTDFFCSQPKFYIN
jgi:hypothetical protein